MTNVSQTILFFGTEDFSAVALEGLIDGGFTIAAVVTKPDSKKGRGRALQPPLVKQIAEEHGIAVWQPERLSEIANDIKVLAPVAGVLVSYGKIIPQSIIDLFTPGIINLHPSLLPRYRGPSPIESAIANGDEATGISIMKLSQKMDAGPVYHQVELHLSATATRPYMYKKLADTGTAELVAALPRILDGSLQAVEQDDSKATYCQLLSKADGLLSPLKLTAEQAERRVRAYLGYPKTRVVIGDQELIAVKAHVSTHPETILDVAFKDKKFLSIDELVGPSGKTMSTAAYLRGYKK